MHLIIFYVFQCLFTKKKRTLPSLEPFNVCLLVKIHRCYSNVQIREFSAVAICNKSNSRFNKDSGSPPRTQRCQVSVLILRVNGP